MNAHHGHTGPRGTSPSGNALPVSTTGFADEPRITLRGPAELADALPYTLGFHPTDSVVLLALHGEHGRFGGRLRLGIPRSPDEWAPVAEQLAECLVEGSERRGSRPDGIVVFLCQDPAEGESGRRVMERLRPFAQKLRTACGALDVPVYEALCLSGGRFWSYCCPDSDCCPPDGTVLTPAGTSVMAAAAAYAGIHVRGSLRDMEARLRPRTARTTVAGQERALDTASAELVHRILDTRTCKDVRDDTIRLARRLLDRLAEHPPLAGEGASDTRDDALITHEEAAELIVGLQDRRTRDRAAEWMEGPEADHALRLWRALARRCVGAYGEHAAAPLTLAGWVAWSTADEPGARIALGLALEADPEYVFARLLHQACNEQLDPETLRECLRGEREARAEAGVRRAFRTRTAGRGAGARGVRRRLRARVGRPRGAGRDAPSTGPGPACPAGASGPGARPDRRADLREPYGTHDGGPDGAASGAGEADGNDRGSA
ncbi:DUF4192 domain-containing protein [Streptomyces somaliensis]|uniref:DUF4192 domain-containing protein n=1 Tax=Streptomyces somaliensis TaxID=78355 RepID=UPI0020CBD247|nr:DUF4192 domain-containing protein [Streptomyces somaliensis]MCP9943972.1 DUF4192 domain-containing protein [Streptomyces somaliensis]MCP9962787.1 DUF4192 domain-containing protein [Streptomyces somaliensis]MCP9975625.1 DUF4192 domain-containing protein [Streptomyces somaliensis]